MATKNDKLSKALDNPGIQRYPINQENWHYYLQETNKVITGSFTPTFTGFSAAPSGTVYWVKEGNWVTLRFSFTTGTSNDTVFAITNFPGYLGCQQARSVIVHGGAIDNGSASTSVVFGVVPGVSTATDVFSFGLGPENAAGGGWNGAAANKGFSSATGTFCSYPVYSQ